METESDSYISNVKRRSSTIDLAVESQDKSSTHPLTSDTMTTMNQTTILNNEINYTTGLQDQETSSIQHSKITLNDISARHTPKTKFKWKNCSQEVFCPDCNKREMSRVSIRSGLVTYLVCIALCCVCPFNTYVFCCDKCKDTYHYCNHCSNLLGSNRII